MYVDVIRFVNYEQKGGEMAYARSRGRKRNSKKKPETILIYNDDMLTSVVC